MSKEGGGFFLRDTAGRAKHEPCAVPGCDRLADWVSPYCHAHRKRKQVFGTAEKRIPNLSNLDLLEDIGLRLLSQRQSNQELRERLEELRFKLREIYKAAPRNIRAKTYKGEKKTPYLLGLTWEDSTFTIDRIIARAAIALAIEESGYYRFPSPLAYRAFIGRACVSPKVKGTLYANQLEPLGRLILQLGRDVLLALAVSMKNKLVAYATQQDLTHQWTKVLRRRRRARKLIAHLEDCRFKPQPLPKTRANITYL